MTWRELLHHVEQRVANVDARRILERASGYDGAAWFAALDEPVPKRAVAFVDGMVERRVSGEPLQYVVGRWGFRSLDLFVDRRVLIPRPETETVVDVALDELGRLPDARVAVDLGTGSGPIALSLATETKLDMWATDASDDALAVAGANLAGAGWAVAPRVRLVAGSWFDALPGDLRGAVDLVVSNPPYIADDEVLPPEVADWEPAGALRAGPTGLEAIEHIVNAAPGWLRRPGVLVVELAPSQADAARGLAAAAGFDDVGVQRDLAGRDRVLVGRVAS